MLKICEKHGEYEAKEMNFFGKVIITGCPECENERNIQEQEEFEKLRQMEIAKNKIARGIEPEYFNVCLEHYKPENLSENSFLQAARDLRARKIEKLIVTGPNGCGKTMLGSAMANELNGIVITMFYLSGKIRQGYNRGMSDIDILDEILSHKFICIDEMGRSKMSDSEKNWLSYLVDKCHVRKIPLMIISNRKLAKSLPKEQQGEALENCFNNDVISRLREKSVIVELQGCRDRRVNNVAKK